MKTYKITIEFKTLPRLGKAGLDDQDALDHLGADQFFSILSLAWIDLFGIDDYQNLVLKPFLEKNIPWCHSSLFPDFGDIFCLPSPILKLSSNDGVIGKKDRQPWINFSCLEKLIRGNKLEKTDYLSVTQEYNYYSVKLSNSEESKPFITTVTGPKQQNLNFTLSGFINLHNPELLSKIDRACRYIADEGIGANRSSGYGQIKQISIKEFGLPNSLNPNRWITLSDYIPDTSELNKIQASKICAYKLISKS
jgi:CRISPR type III-A-associated RAMP protein Csm4